MAVLQPPPGEVGQGLGMEARTAEENWSSGVCECVDSCSLWQRSFLSLARLKLWYYGMASGETVAHSLILDFCSACCRILILTSNAFLAQKKLYIYINHHWEALLRHDLYSGLMEVPNMSLSFLGFCMTERPSVKFLRPAPSHPQCSVPELCHVA